MGDGTAANNSSSLKAVSQGVASQRNWQILVGRLDPETKEDDIVEY